MAGPLILLEEALNAVLHTFGKLRMYVFRNTYVVHNSAPSPLS